MSVLSEIRRLPGEIEGLTKQVSNVAENLHELVELQAQLGTSDERLDALERDRSRWEAEMDARLLRADSTLKSAANAESRSRTMLRHAEKLVDPFDDNSEEGEAPVRGFDDPRSEENQVFQVPVGLAPNNKAEALRAKWLT
jgi:predicted nuclease with TOPRIM domain